MTTDFEILNPPYTEYQAWIEYLQRKISSALAIPTHLLRGSYRDGWGPSVLERREFHVVAPVKPRAPTLLLLSCPPLFNGMTREAFIEYYGYDPTPSKAVSSYTGL